MILTAVIWVLVAFVVLVTLIPLSRISHGAVRSFSFARQQAIIMGVVLLPFAAWTLTDWQRTVALLLLIATTLYQLAYISRFFPMSRVQSLDADPALAANEARCISVLTSNVKLSNRDFQKLIDLTSEIQPDIMVAVEIDDQWAEALSVLHEDYPHRAIRALDNGYGMGLYSRLPLENVHWRELLREGVPSLRATVRLGGELMHLYILHPEPPVPYHSTDGRDAEIGLVGMEVAKDPTPAVVAGDLNDVAWSRTTRRFQRLSGYLDPRVGRGFFNTFHAHVPVWRWPLDHLFHHPRFRLIEMQRLPDIGSDHFPMLFRLALAERNGSDESPEKATEEDREEIEEMAEEERRDKREPIGAHWEDEN
ncbi:endonuclease/exonuclease/phosphatase family protein [Wenxinia marina]|uniref:Endonuclease/exonuclease/phosphatase domain-containing protein n=1 Tax=Wenxinia marina DSM 24838 TaxID=1123501 RepID=A0A0D0Q3K8_9RHOB|nr:endonuclease/exonuclease/phosphatase family protein [Wenxinia marina]KIQ69109.1 hypothetical protein Wenmar_02178 [Wenxinia marina DSM 24838]GGL70327.1 endonuclease [Wenxinia marina]